MLTLDVEVEGLAVHKVPGVGYPVGGPARVVAVGLLADSLDDQVGPVAVHDDPLALVLPQRLALVKLLF